MTFFEYLPDMPTSHKALWVFACLMLMILFEYLSPFVISANRRRNLLVNVSLLVMVTIVNAIATALMLYLLSILEPLKIGVFYWFTLPWWLELLLTIVLLDFVAQFGTHYYLHNIPALWRLHQIHHSDTDVNATTGTRHHPVDYLVRESVSLIVVCGFGIPIAYYMLYRLLTVFFTFFTHGNIRLPEKIDRLLSWVIVTPGAHKFHHHHQMPWTNRNYGNVFSVWDRLFGTFVYADTKAIVYGVDTMDESKAHQLAYQLKAPFVAQSVHSD